MLAVVRDYDHAVRGREDAIRMPSRARREKDAIALADLMEQGANGSVFVLPQGGIQGNYAAGTDNERWPGPGEAEVEVPSAQGQPREEVLAEARALLDDARAEAQRRLRADLDTARKRGDYERARELARCVYRSGNRLLAAIDREERAVRAKGERERSQERLASDDAQVALGAAAVATEAVRLVLGRSSSPASSMWLTDEVRNLLGAGESFDGVDHKLCAIVRRRRLDGTLAALHGILHSVFRQALWKGMSAGPQGKPAAAALIREALANPMNGSPTEPERAWCRAHGVKLATQAAAKRRERRGLVKS